MSSAIRRRECDAMEFARFRRHRSFDTPEKVF